VAAPYRARERLDVGCGGHRAGLRVQALLQPEVNAANRQIRTRRTDRRCGAAFIARQHAWIGCYFSGWLGKVEGTAGFLARSFAWQAVTMDSTISTKDSGPVATRRLVSLCIATVPSRLRR